MKNLVKNLINTPANSHSLRRGNYGQLKNTKLMTLGVNSVVGWELKLEHVANVGLGNLRNSIGIE